MNSHANTLNLSDSGSDLSSVMEVEWPEPNAKEPEIKKKPGEEYFELVKSEYSLRTRRATSDGRSPYLAPWQGRRRRSQSKPEAEIKKEDETEDDEDIPQGLANIPLAGPRRPGHGFQMLLDAASLLDQNDTPCTSFGCPIAEPHGEGMYWYPGEVVADSGFANIYFAPSIPPPAVVEAFNCTTPTLDQLSLRDCFFDFHTTPCRPSKYLSMVWKLPCKSRHCQVKEPHNKGAYLHKGLDASHTWARHVNHAFGISNPPPKVCEAAIRCTDGVGTYLDQEIVDDFSAHHVRFDAKDRNGDMLAKKFALWQKRRMSERP